MEDQRPAEQPTGDAVVNPLGGPTSRPAGDRVDGKRSENIQALADTLSANEDRASFSKTLTELALLARTDEAALQLLLSTIVSHRLADVSIRKIFFDEDAIDDCAQETVLAVIAGIASFRGDAAFLTWLDRVALNVARQVRRRGQRVPEPVPDNTPDQVSWTKRISSIVATEVVVAEAFSRLSQGHRDIIQLREMKGLSYDQIADQTGVPVGTVRSRLSRARNELAHLLASAQQSQFHTIGESGGDNAESS